MGRRQTGHGFTGRLSARPSRPAPGPEDRPGLLGPPPLRYCGHVPETAAQRWIRLDARIPAIAAGAALGVFALVLLVVPAFAVSYDEAKYLSMGASMWAGEGPRTAFGYQFLQHSPLWMTVVYAPTALLGVDTLAWGHLLDGLAGIGVIAIAAIMGRRVSPTAGIVAAFAILAFGYLLALTRTTRLDVPVAFLALLYLEVGWRALRQGSRSWGAAAGIVFAVAVLVKEVAIPLAPVPILCGVLAGIGWTRILRATGWLVLAATVGLAPWFVYYAQETGQVYRVGSPAWTLPLFFVPLLVVIIVGLAIDALASRARMRAVADRLARSSPSWAADHGRAIIGWGAALTWCAALVLFFSRIPRIAGAPFVQLAQYRLYLQTWAFELAPVAVFVAIGLGLAVALLVTDRTARERRGVINALLATICGVPLVLMVVAVGEPPRNYIAQVATAIVVAAGGWSWGVARLIGRLSRGDHRTAVARYGMPVFLALVMLAGTGAVVARAWVTREGTSVTRTAAVDSAVAWVREHVPKGTSIAFGAFLSYEIAYRLVPDYRMTQVQARLSGFDLSMPLGFAWGSVPADDWVAVDIAPRNVNQFGAYRATWVRDDLTRHQVAYWIYSTGASTSAPSILPQLTPDHGFQTVESWRFVDGGNPVTVTILKVDLAKVALDVTKLYVSPEALSRVVTRLEANPTAGKPVAAALMERLVVVPDSGSAADDLARLRAIAGG